MTHWKPSATWEVLQRRACLLSELRAFFAASDVMEVDVPVLAIGAGSDPNIESFTVSSSLGKENYFLMTSPEFYMKRLLAAGSGAVYYLGHAFRAGDSSSRHQPEFTMLEWYRPHWTLQQLMHEVGELVSLFVAGEPRFCTYRELFLQHLALDPHLASIEALKARARDKLSPAFDTDERAVWLDLLFSHLIEPQLHGLVFVSEFPAAQAALAQTCTDAYGNAVAARFELYINGLEIANAYQEELSASILTERFQQNLALRASRGQVLPPADERFLAAMHAGLPACAGVALGVDRLLMVMTGSTNIEDVLPFAF